MFDLHGNLLKYHCFENQGRKKLCAEKFGSFNYTLIVIIIIYYCDLCEYSFHIQLKNITSNNNKNHHQLNQR